jgi:hypothetical protein
LRRQRKTYSADATAECLRRQDLVSSVSTASDDLDVIADNAPGGGIRAEVGAQEIEVQLAFGRTEGDGETLQEQYELFGGGGDAKEQRRSRLDIRAE